MNIMGMGSKPPATAAKAAVPQKAAANVANHSTPAPAKKPAGQINMGPQHGDAIAFAGKNQKSPAAPQGHGKKH